LIVIKISSLKHQIIAGKPAHIRVDNGPEIIAQALESWPESNSIDLKFIPKGKLHKNGYVERFNRS
jgi:putative transposase